MPFLHRTMRASPTLAVYKTRCLEAASRSFASDCDAPLCAALVLELDTSPSVAALTAAAAAGAIAVDPVADCELGILSSQRKTAITAVQPLFLTGGSFSSCWSAVVKVWSNSSGMGVFGFLRIMSSRRTWTFLPHQSAAKVPA